MRPTASVIASFVLVCAVVSAAAQAPKGISKYSDFFRNRPIPNRSKLDSNARAAVQRFNVQSVPYWSAALTYQDTTYPLSFVGHSVFSKNGTSVIEVPVIALKYRFLGYIDPATDKPYEIDATPQIPGVMSSPNFVSAPYSSGTTQYQDAAQRASFYGYYRDDWHTLLRPRKVRTITLDVPAEKAQLFYLIETPSVIFGIMDIAWADAQFHAIIAALNIPVESFPIFISHNVFLATDANPDYCCALGFHSAYFSKLVGISYFIQTYAWADWPSDELSFFGVNDVFGLSHEIAEWMNDPFGVNFVPRWQWVDYYNYTADCSSIFETELLEVGDPVQNYPGYPVTLNGFTYSMTNQVGISWFSRDVPSTGLHGAYSFPDESIAPGPSLSCP